VEHPSSGEAHYALSKEVNMATVVGHWLTDTLTEVHWAADCLSVANWSPSFMESEGLLLRSQEPATGPSPEPVESLHAHIPCPFNIHYNITLPSTARFLKWYLTSRFSCWHFISTCHVYIRAACPTHFILFDSTKSDSNDAVAFLFPFLFPII
jgi:hypothetical protein